MHRRTFLTAAALSPLAGPATAVAAPAAGPVVGRAARRSSRSDARDTALLSRWFEDTYHSIEALTTEHGLAADNVDLTAARPAPVRQTSPTNIGCGLWSTVAAAGLGVISRATLHRRLSGTLDAVERLERRHGFWFNWYDAYDGSTLANWPDTGDPIRPFLSTVDNAWLTTGLRLAADADPTLLPRIERLLAGSDWSFFYTPFDPADPVLHPGQLRGGFWTDTNQYTDFHYGSLNTEPRMASYLGIADGSLPPEHYWYLFRTLLPELGQEQAPVGEFVTVDGVQVWNGHYTYRDRSLVPTWGGSMFEALMVPLFVPEPAWSPGAWRTTHERYVRSQIEHGLDEAKYGYWGFSPSDVPEGGYNVFGVDAIGMQMDGYDSKGVVTPHASFLALPFAREEAIGNLMALDRDFGAYDDGFGFRDSVNVLTGRVSDFVLALDQGMVAAALAQQLRPGLLQRPFRTGGFASRVRPLLVKERFSI